MRDVRHFGQPCGSCCCSSISLSASLESSSDSSSSGLSLSSFSSVSISLSVESCDLRRFNITNLRLTATFPLGGGQKLYGFYVLPGNSQAQPAAAAVVAAVLVDSVGFSSPLFSILD